MVQHKTASVIGGLSVRQLRARRRRLASRLTDPEAMLFGSLVAQGRRCGKEGCRCQQGELHGPYHYLSAPTGGSSRLRYVPGELVAVVRRHLRRTEAMQAVLAEIAAINAELLARRELD
jgi:hypothetical protein